MGLERSSNGPREHLDGLEVAYGEWFQQGNPVATVELEEVAPDETQWLVSRCARIDRPAPVHWGLIVGDVAHNIRAALDHLAHVLVEAGGGAPTRHTAFPLWRVDPFSDRNATSRFERTIEGMPEAAKQLIVAFQPFRSSAAKVVNLAMVADVDNVDKHRIVLPSFMNFAEEIPLATWAVTPTSDQVEVRINRGVRIERGVELARARTLSGRSAMGVNIGFELKVTYGDFTPACTLGSLRAGAAFAEELISGLGGLAAGSATP